MAVEVHLTLSAPDQGTVGVIEEIGFEIKSVEQIDGKLLYVVPNTGAEGPLYGGDGLVSPKPGRYPLTQWGGEIKEKDKAKVVPFLKPGSPVFFSAILSEDRSDSVIGAGATAVFPENGDVTLGAIISIYARVSINGKLKDIHSGDRFQYAFLRRNADAGNKSLRIKYDLLDELQQRAYFHE